eukprot:CAMPEP_0174892694 /NCGR_PEP_ID=MMETSP0167-20121228/7619_1 /TAXON_ID=38298 /ORGANISM="Rhodella maculata, Strain CCMP736" /LENGTH=96 /DNA_ID=CAMNT_0016131275 /DNA_START=150 /DNA_END=438 /DNA_ORIENTATION=-
MLKPRPEATTGGVTCVLRTPDLELLHGDATRKSAQTWDRTRDIKIFSLTLSQLSYLSPLRGRHASPQAFMACEPESTPRLIALDHHSTTMGRRPAK